MLNYLGYFVILNIYVIKYNTMENTSLSAIQSYSQINTDFDKTLKESDLHEIARIPLDKSLSGLIEISSDIPILRTVIAIIKVEGGIAEHMFSEKLIHFLTELKDIDAEKRSKMINKIEKEGKYKIRVGKKLLYIINQCNDYVKAGYIGKLFAAYIEEQIDYSQFLKCVHAIELSDIDTLNSFILDCTEDNLIDLDYTPYVTMGVVSLGDIDSRVEQYRKESKFSKVGKIYPSINDTGKSLQNVLKTYI